MMPANDGDRRAERGQRGGRSGRKEKRGGKVSAGQAARRDRQRRAAAAKKLRLAREQPRLVAAVKAVQDQRKKLIGTPVGVWRKPKGGKVLAITAGPGKGKG